jgi:hypothetical protein
MKVLDVPKSGKLGNTVSYKSRYGQITRQYVVPRDPHTAAQMDRRASFGRARFLWGKLTEEQRFGWNNTAEGSRTEPSLNQSGRLSGYLLFMRINCNLAAIGLPMIQDPPDCPQFDANPVGQLIITNNKDVIALKLKVSRPPASDILVFGSKPHSAGTTYVDHFTIICLLPSPDRGLSEITDGYLAKYPVVPVGSRIFIRTVQQIDGWQDLPKQTTALVPAS